LLKNVVLLVTKIVQIMMLINKFGLEKISGQLLVELLKLRKKLKEKFNLMMKKIQL
jgi:hypothetical protein